MPPFTFDFEDEHVEDDENDDEMDVEEEGGEGGARVKGQAELLGAKLHTLDEMVSLKCAGVGVMLSTLR